MPIQENHTGNETQKPSFKFCNKPQGLPCLCNNLFEGFKWLDLEEAESSRLPSMPGVYVIRIKKRGKDPVKIYSDFIKLVRASRWIEFERYIVSRLERLKRIEKCPIIYIGAAPSSIKLRYRDLLGVRHTIHYPILALLIGGWRLEYGFRIVNTRKDALDLEKELKRRYREIHGKLPALVER